MDNPNDVKELIPEFFYFPEFLENQNGKVSVLHSQSLEYEVRKTIDFFYQSFLKQSWKHWSV